MSVASSTIFIRPAAAFDAEAMAAIHRACFAKNWSAGEIAQFVSAPGCLSLLASLVTANKRCKGSLSSEAPATRLKS